MGFSIGKGFFTPRGVSLLGKLPGEATGLLDKVSGTFIFKGFDTNGKAILHEVTTFPTL